MVMTMEGCPVMYQHNEFTLKGESTHKELKDSLEPEGYLNTLILPFSYLKPKSVLLSVMLLCL